MMTLELADRARRGEPLTGALIRLPAEEIVEMLALSGLNFVLIDCEHGPADVTELRRHIAYAQAHGVEVWVRVGQDEPALILRALDAGASGIMAPHVDTPEQARALVDAVHYPPLGHRGFATYGRAGRFGLVPPEEHRRRYLDHVLVLAMPESPLAARQATETFAVPGLDGYMIGTADLAASTLEGDPPPAESCAAIHRAGQGLIRVDIVGSRAAADAARADGAQVIVYNLTAVLMQVFTELAGDSATR